MVVWSIVKVLQFERVVGYMEYAVSWQLILNQRVAKLLDLTTLIHRIGALFVMNR